MKKTDSPSGRWDGACERIGNVKVSEMSDWVRAIPFEDWPQQHPVDDQLRPAMVSSPDWHGFRHHANMFLHDNPPPPSIESTRVDNMMLSVVMPGHRIEPHKDNMAKEWICRIHVPLQTNPGVRFIIDGEEYEMWVGGNYKVNISREHSVVNNGPRPRIHFMFDCYGG